MASYYCSERPPSVFSTVTLSSGIHWPRHNRIVCPCPDSHHRQTVSGFTSFTNTMWWLSHVTSCYTMAFFFTAFVTPTAHHRLILVSVQQTIWRSLSQDSPKTRFHSVPFLAYQCRKFASHVCHKFSNASSLVLWCFWARNRVHVFLISFVYNANPTNYILEHLVSFTTHR